MKRILVLMVICSLVFLSNKQDTAGEVIKRTGVGVQPAKGRSLVKEDLDKKLQPDNGSIMNVSGGSIPVLEEATGKDVLLEWFLMRNAS